MLMHWCASVYALTWVLLIWGPNGESWEDALFYISAILHILSNIIRRVVDDEDGNMLR